jgi:alpha-tubulin suppressor-like RCC1 family protein
MDLTSSGGDGSKIDFNISRIKLQHQTQNQVSSEEPASASAKPQQIISNDDNVFALDDRSGIYLVPNLLFRLNEIMKIVKVACGFDHFIILTDTGALYSWGKFHIKSKF